MQSPHTLILLLTSRACPRFVKQLASACGVQHQAPSPALAQLLARSMHGTLHHQQALSTLAAGEASQSSSYSTPGWLLGALVCAGVLCSSSTALADAMTPWQRPSAVTKQAPSLSTHTSTHTSEHDAAIVQTLTQDPTCASAVALTAPLCLLLGSCDTLGPAAMSALADSALTFLTQFAASSRAACTWEVAALARGMALLAGPGLQALASPLVSELQRVLTAACQPGSKWPLQDLASLAWAVSVVNGGLSSQELTALQTALSQLPQRGSAAKQLWDDGSCLLLLDTLLLTAARLGGSSSCDPAGPRVSKTAVQSLAQACGPAAARAIMETFDAYMPLEPHVPGALFPQLHAALFIQHLPEVNPSSIPTSKPATGWSVPFLSGSQEGASQQPVSAAIRALAVPECVGAAGQAQALLSGHLSHELAGLKRDLHWHWRQDQAVDVRQRAANEAAYVLGHGLGLPVLRPPDADIVLPQHRLVILIRDGTTTPSASGGVGSPPPMTLSAGLDALARCARERFRPVARYCPAASAGLAAAHVAMVQQLGWQVVTLGTAEWGVMYGQSTQRSMSPPKPECVARVKAWLDTSLRP